ncbi:MAG: DUF885 family protein [Candidatus Krumholzibacteriota bacterium]|nr:DUF885 family protein [Candidatus Krumholzibacteriota bacterium]
MSDRYIDSGRSRERWFPVLFIALLLPNLSLGCGDDAQVKAMKDRFESIKKEAVSLYLQLHPLRCSRLGMTSADSLLFTFSKEELSHQTGRIESLLELFSGLSASGLGESEMEESSIILFWLRGEAFALKKLRNHEHNPLLYCWMIDEALFGIPSRGAAPPEEEYAAYLKRIDQIPLLLDNARSNLRNPAELHVARAIERLSVTLEGFEGLQQHIERRYGSLPGSISSVGRSVSEFRDHLRDTVLPDAHGRHIMGIEDLSDLLKYSEHLDIDIDQFITEAEKSIRKQRSQLASIEKNPLHAIDKKDSPLGAPEMQGPPDPEPSEGKDPHEEIETIRLKILEQIAGQNIFGRSLSGDPEIVWTDLPALPEDLPVDPYLVVPEYVPDNMTWTVCGLESGRSKNVLLLIDRRLEDLDYPGILYRLISTMEPLYRAKYKLCREDSPIKRIFVSRLYLLAWKALNYKDITTLDPDHKLSIRKLYLEEKNLELARMLITLRLHSGRSTVDSSVEFLMKELGMTKKEAAMEVAIASATPSVGYPGLAVMLLDDMSRTASSVKRDRNPRNRIREMMLENIGLPLPMITGKITE